MCVIRPRGSLPSLSRGGLTFSPFLQHEVYRVLSSFYSTMHNGRRNVVFCQLSKYWQDELLPECSE